MAKGYVNDDIYAGFLEPSVEKIFYNLDTEDGNYQVNYGSKDTAALRSRGSTSDFLKTGERILARPPTALQAVGYAGDSGKIIDPALHQKNYKKTVSEKKYQEPHEKYKSLEKKIQNLIEESILDSTGPNSNNVLGLKKAREASSLDRTLLKLRDQNGGTSYHNFDLMYSVYFNLGNLYAKNEMFVEAINTFSIATKNRMFPHVNRLKVNVGNIYFRMGIYPKAIKMYRMALDQVPNNQKELRLKITHNIGVLFIKMGQYSDAAASFEFIMSERPDINSGLHLILCYYAMTDIEKMKKAFKALVDIQIDFEDDIKMQTDLEDNTANQHIFEAIKTDELAMYFNKKKKMAEKAIMMTADLISSVIEENYSDGYTWCIEVIKSSNFISLANELELNKALIYLRQNDVNQAIETLRLYEKKEPTVAVNALTNLTFIYLHLGDLQNATKYAEICRKNDSYNPGAFINCAVCEMKKGDLEMAKHYLKAALEIDSTSFEAMYNLGLVLKQLGEKEEAQNYFMKIKSNLSHAKHPHTFYQLATIQENSRENSSMLDWFLQLLGILPEVDPGIYEKVGRIFDNLGDRQEANQYYSEAFRVNPSDVDIASSIGSYYIQAQAVEKATYYYERAVLANPNDPNLMLRAAACFRHVYPPRKYLSLFEDIYSRFPENLFCVRALIHITESQGMTELNEKYIAEHNRIEKIIQSRNKMSGSSRKTVKTPQERGKLVSSSRGSNESDYALSRSFNDDSQQAENGSNGFHSGYTDPLGSAVERPRTMQTSNMQSKDSDEYFDPDELLPL